MNALRNRVLKLEDRQNPVNRSLDVTVSLAGEYRGVHYSISQHPIKARLFCGAGMYSRRLVTSRRTFANADDAQLSVERYIDRHYQALAVHSGLTAARGRP